MNHARNLCFLLALCGLLTLAHACAEQGAVNDAADGATKAVSVARQNLDEVAAFLESAQKNLAAVPALNEALTGFRAAYEAEEYSRCLEHLEAGVEAVTAAGHDVTPDVVKRLTQARVLLELAGK